MLVCRTKKEIKTEQMRCLPWIVPTNPLHLVSCMSTLRLVPLSRVASRLMSSTARRMAVAAELPMTESKVKRAPMVTLGGRAGRATARALHMHSARRSLSLAAIC